MMRIDTPYSPHPTHPTNPTESPAYPVPASDNLTMICDLLAKRGLGMQLMFSTKQTAQLLGRSPQTIMLWRKKGKGPAYTVINGCIYYKLINIVQWLQRLPEIEVDTYDTSLPDAPDIIITWYHAHGTSEQFHSEIKSDMNLERLPSGKFAANALVLLLGLVAYNCLRLCGPR